MAAANDASTEILLAVAAAGGVGTAFGSGVTFLSQYITGSRANRHAEKVWLREKRYEVYSELFALMTSLEMMVDEPFDAPKPRAAKERYVEVRAKAQVVSNQKAFDVIYRYSLGFDEAYRLRKADTMMAARQKMRQRLMPFITYEKQVADGLPGV